MPSPPHKYAVFASGRGSNLKAMLDACADGGLSYKPSLTLTDNKLAPALDHARQHGVETLFIDPKEHKGRKAFAACAIRELKARGIDTICLAGFMRIVDKSLVDAFRLRIINIHPSLLPAFPGLDAQQQAVDSGARESGCTVHFVDEGVDTGPAILQAKVMVDEGETAESLAKKILAHEHRIYPIVIQALMEDRIRMVDGKAILVEKSR